MQGRTWHMKHLLAMTVLVSFLAPAAAKYESISSLSPTIYVRLGKLAKEFERNGFQMKKLSARKYKFFKPGGSSFVVTAGKNNIVQAEEAEWFLRDEISKDAVKEMRRAMT